MLRLRCQPRVRFRLREAAAREQARPGSRRRHLHEPDLVEEVAPACLASATASTANAPRAGSRLGLVAPRFDEVARQGPDDFGQLLQARRRLEDDAAQGATVDRAVRGDNARPEGCDERVEPGVPGA